MTAATDEGSAITYGDARPAATIQNPDDATRRWVFARHTPRVTRKELVSYGQRKVAGLTQIPRGWDGRSAPPIDAGLAALAVDLLDALIFQDDLPTPQFAPRTDGGLEISWLVAGREILIAVGAEELSIWAVDDDDHDLVTPIDVAYRAVDQAALIQVIMQCRGVLQDLSTKVEHPLPLQ
jgi:hypothetical protein